MKAAWNAAAGVVVTAAVMAVSGCGAGSTTVTKNPVTPVAAVKVPSGEVRGGAQPVVGMTMHLYAAGTTGYGSAATDVFAFESLTAPVTNSGGSFSFPTGWSCIHPSDQVYLVGIGGQPFAAGGDNPPTNANLALMVALGTCGTNLTPTTHIHINELTTVAGVWALAPFMTGNTLAYQTVGSSTTNATGITLAMNAAAQLVSTSAGSMPGTNVPAGATLPQSEVNTLADVMEACINSGGENTGPNDGTACGSLFYNAPNGAGNAYPTDTITAAMNIAQNPARNVMPLYGLLAPTPAFQPHLVTQPNAWTIAIQYTLGGLNAPTSIAADQSGHIWVGNSGNTNVVSLFDNLGNPLVASGTTLAGTPSGVAIDLSGNAWVTAANSMLYELNSSGTQTAAYGGNGLNLPTSIAIDPSSNVWVVNSGSGANSVSAFTSAGVPLTGSPFTGAGISAPAGIAINGNANANCADCH